MASEQVQNWINGSTTIGKNKPLQLSKKVESFETDFSNGYLFGEILQHYGLLNQVSATQSQALSQFSKKTNKEAQVQNFYLVENALRSIKVRIDGRLIHKIMQQQKDAAMNLLYQLKIALDSHFSDSNITLTGLKQQKVEEKVREMAELSSVLPSIHKKFGVEGPTFKAVPLQIVEKKLLKFEVARANLEKQAQQDDLAEQKLKQDLFQSKRQSSIKKLKETHQFFQDWEDQGRKNWKQNREARAKEIERQLYFEDKEVKIYKKKLSYELEVHALQAEQGIELFHENMQRLGIEQNISIQEAVKRQEEKKGIPPGQIQNFSYPATMSKIKETKANNEFAGKERERRRRKMLVDQQKIQETLDKKKNEEELIIRLLQIQLKEQEKSYNIWRQNQCQLVVNKNMQNQAIKLELVKQKKNQVYEEQIKKEVQEGEAARRDEIEIKNQEYQKERRAAKLKKRKLNIEIASEFIDLILDLSEVAYDTLEENKQKEGEDQLISKPSWRNWMDLFTEGKKVSEENLVIMADESQGLKAVPSEGPLARLLNEKADKGELYPIAVVNEMKNEPEYLELLQYLSMCGPLNLRLVAPQKWHSFKNIPSKFNPSKLDINLGFLDQFYPPLNSELGGFIQNLQEQLDHKMNNLKSDQLLSFDGNNQKNTFTNEYNSQGNEEKTKIDFPNYHNFRICITGQLLAGKKTIAKIIQKKFGEQKINIFDMNEILREALIYVDPNQVKEEVIDPKAKAAKGKASEAPVDIFVGKDTTKYKEIAVKLLKSIQLTTGNETSIPGKEVDLLQLVADDELLVQLFIQKLTLVYPTQGKTRLEKEAIMRQNLIKKKELEDLIEEAKTNEATEAADTKAKGKGAKAGGQKSVLELQQEVKDLISADGSGWVLIDFPRNIKQAKLLEIKFTGFKANTDNEKTESVQNFEIWSKITDPIENKKKQLQIKNQQSLFDGFLILKVPTDECQRRGQNRKIDPTNGQVYHLEDDPPAQGDNKFLERLQDFFGVFQNASDMNDKIKKSGIFYKSSEQELQKFMNEFGYFDIPTAKGMKALLVLDIQKAQKKEISEQQVLFFIDQILQFKQVIQDRSYKELEVKIKKEDETREIEAQLAKEKESQLAREKESQEAQALEMSPQGSKANIEASDDNQRIADNLARRASRTSFLSIKTISQISHAVNSKKQKRISYTVEHMKKMWDQMAASYMAEGMAALNAIKKQRTSVTNGLNNSQRQFITFLQRPCNKQDKVNEFVQSFNKFSSEFPDLRADDQTKEELKVRVQKLSNDLWDIIDARKNESLAKIAEMTSGGWSDHEMRQLVRNMASLMEIEINKFVVVHHISVFQEPAQELDALILSKKLLDRGVKPYDGATDTSPVLEQVIANLLTKLQELLNHTAVQSASPVNQSILLSESQSLIYRLAMIYAWALAVLDEIYLHSRQVYERMDDWVVEAVAQEYSISSTMISFIKEAISNELLQIEDYQGQLQSLELYQSVQILQFLSTEIPIYLQNVHIPLEDFHAVNFSPLNLSKFLIDIHQTLGCDGYPDIIEYHSFLNLLLINLRQGKFPLVWKYLNFEKIQQNLKNFSTEPIDFKSQNRLLLNQSNQKPKRDWINWKQFLTCLVLSRSSVPTEADLIKLQEDLTENQKTSINFKKFQKQAFWFDSDEGKPDQSLQQQWRQEKQQELEALENEDDEEEITIVVDEYIKNKLDEERLDQIKNLLFNIYRVQTGEDKLEINEFIEKIRELIKLVKDKSGQISKFAALFLN